MRSKWYALGVVVTFLAGACGGSSDNAPQRVTLEATPAAMQRAADSTTAQTSKVDMKMSMSFFGQQFEMTGTGALDPVNRRTTLSIDMSNLFEGLGRLTGDTVPASLSSALQDPMTMIIDGSEMYMHFPALASELPGGKEWMKVDMEKATGVSGLFGDTSGSVGGDPSAMLQFLQGTDDVKEVGREDVRGEATTHYHGSYTLQDALDKTPESKRGPLEDAMNNLGVVSALDTPIPFDAWIGDDGLVRRFDMTIDFDSFAPKSASLPPGALVTYSMEFHDFGSAVEIDLPDDGEVVDVTSMLPQSKFSSVASSIN